MALKLQTGVENLTAPEKRSGKFTNQFWWSDGDRKFLAFTTPAADIPKVLIHGFVKVPTGDDEKPFRNGTFFCRKDPAFAEDGDGTCYVCDVLDLKPTVRFAAMAVELEPEFEGKKVTGLSVKYNKGQDDKEYPQVGLILQSKKLFFAYLGAYNETRADITTVVFDVLRQGAGADDTKYIFFDLQDRPSLDTIEEFIPDVSDALENLGTVEKYAELEASGARAEDQQRFGEEYKKFQDKQKGDPKPKSDDPAVEEDFDKLSKELGLAPAS